MNRFTVAIDGPAAAGKGTISRKIAKRFGLAFLDTGLLYRAVAKKVMEISPGAGPDKAAEIAATIDLDNLGDEQSLRTREISAEASRIASMPEVRNELSDLQRQFARRPGGAVLDGRDIGTVICPEAEVKLFLTASDEIRAERRCRELALRGEVFTHSQILQDIRDRDSRDIKRKHSALCIAVDAVLINTSELSIDEAAAQAVAAVYSRVKADEV